MTLTLEKVVAWMNGDEEKAKNFMAGIEEKESTIRDNQLFTRSNEAVAEEGAVIDNFVVQGVINPLSLEENEFNGLRIYPNPVNGLLNVTSDTSLINAKISLFDITGRVLSNAVNVSIIDSNKLNVNVSNLASGNYFITIEDDSHKSTKQFIKN